MKYLAEELSLGGLLQMAVTSQSGLSVFLDLAKQAVTAKGESIPELDYIKAIAQHAAPRAKQQVDDGFHMIHVHALINMWGALSTALEQTIGACIENDGQARCTAMDLLQDRGDRARALKSDETTAMASRLIQRATNSRPAHEAYAKLCAKFDLILDRRKYRFDDLEEVRCIRNSLVHREGIVSQQMANAVAAFRGKVGERIRLNGPSSVRYADAMSNFNLALSDAAIHSRYCLGGDLVK